MKRNEIINIIICYNNADEVIQYHQEILKCKNGNLVGDVVVVNSETDDNLRELCDYAEKNSIYLFNPKKNLGYMNGLLYGYRCFYKQEAVIPRYVIMSNTDIQFSNEDFFCFLEGREYDEDVWCIGPSILVNELHSYDNPVAEQRFTSKYIKSLIWRFSTPIIRELYVSAAFIKPKFIKRKKVEESKKVYLIHGCFFILKGEYAEVLKDKEFGVLLYSEELFVAENAYILGKTAYYDADLEVVHMEHSTTKKLKPRQRAKYLEESMRWIFSEYYFKE